MICLEAEIVEQEKKEQEELDKMDLKAILEEQQQLQRLKESYIDDLVTCLHTHAKPCSHKSTL